MYSIKLIYSGFVFGKLLSFARNKEKFINFFFKIYKKQIKYSIKRIKLRRLVYRNMFIFKVNVRCFIFINIFIYFKSELYFYNFFL